MNLDFFTQTEPGRVSARVFFEHVCPVLFEARADACKAVGGRYGFRLAGDDGGSWVLDFEQLHALEEDGDADVVVEMPSLDFKALLSGSLDVNNAYVEGRLNVEGDVTRLHYFAAFTQPLASGGT